jgi:hypothetical protein
MISYNLYTFYMSLVAAIIGTAAFGYVLLTRPSIHPYWLIEIVAAIYIPCALFAVWSAFKRRKAT